MTERENEENKITLRFHGQQSDDFYDSQ